MGSESGREYRRGGGVTKTTEDPHTSTNANGFTFSAHAYCPSAFAVGVVVGAGEGLSDALSTSLSVMVSAVKMSSYLVPLNEGFIHWS
jgi:hypothetical protein